MLKQTTFIRSLLSQPGLSILRLRIASLVHDILRMMFWLPMYTKEKSDTPQMPASMRDSGNRSGVVGSTYGFTLIEMMVSVSIFTIVMIAGIGMLFTVSDAYNSTRARGNAMNALGVALENMSRTMRTGVGFDCDPAATPSQEIAKGRRDECTFSQGGSTAVGSENTIKFLDQDGVWTEYEFIEDGDPDTNDGYVEKTVRFFDDGSGAETSSESSRMVTSSDFVNITDVVFYIDGLSPNDGVQPIITIVVGGQTTFRRATEDFTLQTTVVQRVLDNVSS